MATTTEAPENYPNYVGNLTVDTNAEEGALNGGVADVDIEKTQATG